MHNVAMLHIERRKEKKPTKKKKRKKLTFCLLSLCRGICTGAAAKAAGSGLHLLYTRDSVDREKSVWNVVERTRTTVETELLEILELGICAQTSYCICSANWAATSCSYFHGIWAVRAGQQPSCPNITA
jgi:hypothetical protein